MIRRSHKKMKKVQHNTPVNIGFCGANSPSECKNSKQKPEFIWFTWDDSSSDKPTRYSVPREYQILVFCPFWFTNTHVLSGILFGHAQICPFPVNNHRAIGLGTSSTRSFPVWFCEERFNMRMNKIPQKTYQFITSKKTNRSQMGSFWYVSNDPCNKKNHNTGCG